MLVCASVSVCVCVEGIVVELSGPPLSNGAIASSAHAHGISSNLWLELVRLQFPLPAAAQAHRRVVMLRHTTCHVLRGCCVQTTTPSDWWHQGVEHDLNERMAAYRIDSGFSAVPLVGGSGGLDVALCACPADLLDYGFPRGPTR